MPRISYFAGKSPESQPIDWPVVPRVDEYIYPQDHEEYKVTKVVHVLHRTAAGEAQIQLYVEKSGN